MTYLVTGGAGFIGSRVVRDLVKEGESVVVYDWFPERRNLERCLSEDEISAKVKIVTGDVRDYPHLLRTLTENHVNTLVHMAGMMILEVNADPLLGTQVNCAGTVTVFEAARFLGIKKVVWPSSGSVYGPPERYPQEFIPVDAPHDPQNVYGAAKSYDEFLASYYCNRYKMDITAVRFVMVYGSGQSRGRTAAIIQQMVVNPALGRPGKVPAAADNVLGWTYVDDAARALVMASRTAHPKSRAYSLMGSIHTVKEIADYVTKLFPKADIVLLPLERSASHTIMTCKYDMKPLEEDIGFRPQWTMKQGMLVTINEARREHGLPPVSD